MERINYNLANRVITDATDNHLPVGGELSSSHLIHGAMDNFDHNENTPSGIGSSHDTGPSAFSKFSG